MSIKHALIGFGWALLLAAPLQAQNAASDNQAAPILPDIPSIAAPDWLDRKSVV